MFACPSLRHPNLNFRGVRGGIWGFLVTQLAAVGLGSKRRFSAGEQTQVDFAPNHAYLDVLRPPVC